MTNLIDIHIGLFTCSVMDRKPGHLTRAISKVASSLVWIKIVGIGDVGVGKTCLIKHFCESKFTNSYQPTVGVDYGFKIQSSNATDLRVHLWDLSGSEEYVDVRNELYSNTDAIFLVYDITKPASFDSLETWLKEIQKYSTQNPIINLVGTKVDKRNQRATDPTKARQWAQEHNMKYYETSSATGEGVETMFNDTLEQVVLKKGIKPTPAEA